VLPDPGFVYGVEVVFVVVGSFQVVSGTGCAVLAWRYYLQGNSQEGCKQRHKVLQIKPRDLQALVTFRQLQFNFTSSSSAGLKCSRQQATTE